MMHALQTGISVEGDPLAPPLSQAEFVFENPNAKGACGCGESFNV